YWSTGTRDKELKVILPLLGYPNPYLKVTVNYDIIKGICNIYLKQSEHIWQTMINGGRAEVGEQIVYVSDMMTTKLNFKISCHRIVEPDELFSTEERTESDVEERTESNDVPVYTGAGAGESSGRPLPNEQIDESDESDESIGPGSKTNDTPQIVCQKYVIVSSNPMSPTSRNRVHEGHHIITLKKVFIKEVLYEASFYNEIKWLKELQSEWVVEWMDLGDETPPPNIDLIADFSMDIFALSGIFYFLWVKKLMYNDTEELQALLNDEFASVKQKIGDESVSKMILMMSKVQPDDRCQIDDVMEDLKKLMGGRRRRGTEDVNDD
ncbi:5641_t:CDS:2, partial [Acaulospora colombiana]